jgi:EAL domain-containing protein (putative c-di-GMP-specific phosphodiesterase class I)
VLRAACAQVRAWREMGLPPLRISVNLSAHQFQTEDLADTIVKVLRETPVSPRSLDIEITESAMMRHKEVTVAVLQKLKGIGVTVSLDDFGTGYSSLSYLKGFPIDTIKIDRSFIRDLTTDPDNAAITAAIISMAKTLSLRVVAEGVETEAQLAFLREHGCDEMQGFLFSPPMPADEATELLREMPPMNSTIS